MKKGIVFTTDGALALTITLAVLAVYLFYVQDSMRSRWADVNLVRAAYDLGIALDMDGVLSSGNRTMVAAGLNSARPENLLVSLKVSKYVYLNGTPYLLGAEKYGDNISGDRLGAKIISTDSHGGYFMTIVEVGPK